MLLLLLVLLVMLIMVMVVVLVMLIPMVVLIMVLVIMIIIMLIILVIIIILVLMVVVVLVMELEGRRGDRQKLAVLYFGANTGLRPPARHGLTSFARKASIALAIAFALRRRSGARAQWRRSGRRHPDGARRGAPATCEGRRQEGRLTCQGRRREPRTRMALPGCRPVVHGGEAEDCPNRRRLRRVRSQASAAARQDLGDRSVAQAIARADPPRPFQASSRGVSIRSVDPEPPIAASRSRVGPRKRG
jgi:hypothetical protein